MTNRIRLKNLLKKEVYKILNEGEGYCLPCEKRKKILKEEEKAFHGTSHLIKCFRTAAIGGGTGIQAFGWGLYFGKDVNIAAGYKGVGTNAGKKQILFQGKTPEELAFEYDNGVFERLPRGLSTAEEYIRYAQETIEMFQDEEFENKDELIADYQRFIDIIKNLEVETEDMMYVYEVILHKGKTPDQYTYLDWDKSSTPQDQVNKINKQADKENLEFQVSTTESPSSIYRKIEKYFDNKGSKWGAKDASLFLLKAGIDGNTHNNGQVRIIFDEKAITIVNICSRGK